VIPKFSQTVPFYRPFQIVQNYLQKIYCFVYKIKIHDYYYEHKTKMNYFCVVNRTILIYE